MKVAWLTHREWDRSGGAEAADMDMVGQRPSDVEVTVIRPGGLFRDDLRTFDRIVVTGLFGFASRELNWLQDVNQKVSFWVHDSQFAGHWFYDIPKNVIFVSNHQAKHDIKALPGWQPKYWQINPGWMDVNEILGTPRTVTVLRQHALWAHRPVQHKGLDLAVDWAKEKGVRLDVIVGREPQEVWSAMAEHEYFVLLSHIFDPCPRAVMEAQLLECEVVLNDKVGWFDESPYDLANRLQNAGDAFWSVVLQ